MKVPFSLGLVHDLPDGPAQLRPQRRRVFGSALMAELLQHLLESAFVDIRYEDAGPTLRAFALHGSVGSPLNGPVSVDLSGDGDGDECAP